MIHLLLIAAAALTLVALLVLLAWLWRYDLRRTRALMPREAAP